MNPMDQVITDLGINFRNDWQLGALSGTVVEDLGSGTPRNGTIGSAVGLGYSNSATQFVDRSAAMLFPDAANGQIAITGWDLPSADFSMGVWYKTDDTSKDQYAFSHAVDSNNNLHMLFRSTGLQVRARRGGTNIGVHTSGWTPENGVWYFVVYTLSGSTASIYINGVAVSTTTGSNLTAGAGTAIGGLSDNSNPNRMDGIIQRVFVLDQAISAQGVTDVWGARRPANALHYTDWDTLTDFTVSGTGVSVANNQLTVNNTAAVTITAGADTVSTSEPWVQVFPVNPGGGAGYKFRLIYMDGASNAVGMISFEGTSLFIDDDAGGLGTGMTNVTPANWNHNSEQMVYVAGDPSSGEIHFFLLHLDTLNNDQYTYLGAVNPSANPDRWRMATGGTAGLSTVPRPSSVWKATDAVLTIGDSIATGSPLYSPVPRYAPGAASTRDQDDYLASSIGFWYAGSKFDRPVVVLNMGQGGAHATAVRDKRQWFNHVKAGRNVILVGTNDINNGDTGEDVIALYHEIRAATAYPLTFCTIVARPNATDKVFHETNRGIINRYIVENTTHIDADALTVRPGDNQDLRAEFYPPSEPTPAHLNQAGYQAIGQGLETLPETYCPGVHGATLMRSANGRHWFPRSRAIKYFRRL